MATPKFDHILDTSGQLCPLPVLRTRRKLAEMPAGSTLKVTTTDPATLNDIPALCSMNGHKLLQAHSVGSSYIFEIECGRAPAEDEASD